MRIDIDFDNILGEIREEIQERKREIASEIFDRVVELTPEDTGRARDGWYISEVGDDYEILNDVHYVQYLEYGTDRMAPFGMVSQSVEEVVG